MLNKKRPYPDSNAQKDMRNSNKKLKSLNDQPINRVANNPKHLIDDYYESEEEIKGKFYFKFVQKIVFSIKKLKTLNKN